MPEPDAKSGWSATSERWPTSLLSGTVAASIVTAVEPQLYAAERRALCSRRRPATSDAWDYVIRALSFIAATGLRATMRWRSTSCRPRYGSTHPYARALGGLPRMEPSRPLERAQLARSAGGLAAVLAPATERAARCSGDHDRERPVGTPRAWVLTCSGAGTR